MDMVIKETPIFTKLITDLMSDDEYRLLQEALVAKPDGGDVIPHTGGLRKLRWAYQKKGKRGGIRVIYYWECKAEVFIMLIAYPKSHQDNLTPEQAKILRAIVEGWHHE